MKDIPGYEGLYAITNVFKEHNMKKLILTILITTALFAFEIRDSESGIKPDRFRKLQGGVLIAYNIEKVETDSTLMYEYDEVLIKKAKNIGKVPEDTGLSEDEKQKLRDKLINK